MSSVLTPPRSAPDIWKNRRKIPFIPTFSKKLNDFIGGGLRSENVYTVTGAPGVGKTGVALEFADAAVMAGHPVIFVSVELTQQLVIARYAGKKLKLGWLEVLDNESPEIEAKVTQFTDYLGDYFWVLDPEQCEHFEEYIKRIYRGFVDAKKTEHKKMTGQDLSEIDAHVNVLVVIDYLQDLAAVKTSNIENYRSVVGSLSRQIRSLAKELFVPFLVISSSSRAFYSGQEEQKDSNLIASAKDAGEVEYDSAAVIALKRKDAGDFTGLELYIAKNRFGPANQSVLFKYDPKTGAIQETEATADALKLKVILDAIGEAIFKNPGKYKNAAMLAKAVNMKMVDVKAGLAIFEQGTYGGYKLAARANDSDGYYLMAPTS